MELNKLYKEESGQGMVEYGLILALVAIVAISTLVTLGENSIKPIYNKIKEMFPAA
ncbi:pilus assembly protein Flp/PilA [Tissierella praeacuta DSM 18095]|uniref:Pilus assembly protein Flp/PilA n=1 Tax=Tissierella praeacuta DSM 18095 TaxID=1123404 RepID=A0A1M4XJ38_9FIRM|nr:Flp family type IVb pilin [Tissierella praeacuta]TCU67834.1 pilus assembly protein Flp/PilA [Tissierella praeacuta]SHE93333.1 pilus assembly protein Flp/PilA [Tissierella praeacuta DSM 18095]SUP02086.1 Flp pilus assembly protein, pilin Flp [Tissierella praeacuta]